jgi:cohesin loading factor subunit SCC2
MIRIFGVTLSPSLHLPLSPSPTDPPLSLDRLRAEATKLSKAETSNSVNPRQLSVLSEFDRVRDEQPGSTSFFLFSASRNRLTFSLSPSLATKAAIDSITPRPISEQVFALLVAIHNLPVQPVIKQAALTSLGYVYRAYPTLMLLVSSTGIIDAIFDSPNPQMHLQVLRIIADFLASQEQASASAAVQTTKKKKVVQGVKMEELVGNVEGFADSGCVFSSYLLPPPSH